MEQIKLSQILEDDYDTLFKLLKDLDLLKDFVGEDGLCWNGFLNLSLDQKFRPVIYGSVQKFRDSGMIPVAWIHNGMKWIPAKMVDDQAQIGKSKSSPVEKPLSLQDMHAVCRACQCPHGKGTSCVKMFRCTCTCCGGKDQITSKVDQARKAREYPDYFPIYNRKEDQRLPEAEIGGAAD